MEYSIVIPLKDEEGNIRTLIEEIEPVMNGLKTTWELICVDDGSKDQTPFILEELKRQKPYLRILSFSQNRGQSSAFDAGFKYAKGSYIVTLDGDLQNDPKDIPKLIAEQQGADLVCGVRMKRHDPWNKRVISFFANWIRGKFCGDRMQDTGCSLKLYRASCLKKIKLYQGMHRFLPALFLIEGFSVKEVLVHHRKRVHGKTKYHFFNRSFNTIADMLAVRWMKKRSLHYKCIEK